jgi:hypothetical protein
VSVHNFFYYDERRIDLNKLRIDAVKTATGDDRNKPMTAIIHYHDSEVECQDKKHEKYWLDEEGELQSRKYTSVLAHTEVELT